VRCPVCGAGPARPKLRKDGIQILDCPACGLAWWEPPPGFRPEALYDGAYFADPGERRGYDDYAGLEPALRRSFARRLARLPAPEPGARLLDVGAAFGFGVSEARTAGWRAIGLERSREAASAAARALPGRITVATGLRLPFGDRRFDAVTLWDVLEHLPAPHAALAEVARVLRPGGRLALTTGDAGSWLARLSGARWHLYNLPEHLFFYTRRSLCQLVAAHGLRVESLRSESSLYPLGYLAERLRKTLLGRPGRRAARWPGARLCLPVNLFDVVALQAVRSGGG
jgi:SAM-dependent methyltransferase